MGAESFAGDFSAGFCGDSCACIGARIDVSNRNSAAARRKGIEEELRISKVSSKAV